MLAELDGRTWLLLDEAARSFTHADGTPVSGTRAWLGPHVAEASGFVAAITSLHVDGRIRQRACRVLAELTGPVPVRALAVRLLDHVPQVREQAQEALAARLNVDTAAPVLDVVLAGRDRRNASEALSFVRSVLGRQISASDLVEALLGSGGRNVRRWALCLGHELDLLTPARLLAVVRGDGDQWARATAAEYLVPIARPEQLLALLQADTVEVRLVALLHVPDADLDDQALLPLLGDRAPRVREQARRLAVRRGIDPAGWYRAQIASGDASVRTLAASLDGLGVVGGKEDQELFIGHLGHVSARVRSAAVVAVSTHAARQDSLSLLAPVLLDPSRRASSAASKALVRLEAPQSAAAAAWTSPQPWSRQAAWQMSRGRGGWDRLEADLRAASSHDSALAEKGRAGVRSWLKTGAATTWAVLSDAQRRRIRVLLTAGVVDEAASQAVAFHAGEAFDW